ncbi:MAG: hypothetical protein Q7S79_03275 [bacterium]|nr:hypothetical protein [bacterium]
MAKYRNYIVLALVTLFTTFLVWLPFILRLDKFWGIELPQAGMATVVANYDGPYYIVAAKSFYDPSLIEGKFPFNLEPIYYSAHYPLYPALIRVLATVIPGLGYPYAMMLVTLGTSILAVWMFYILLRDLGLSKNALWLSSLFTFFPARWLIVHSVGSPEPLFIFCVLGAIYFFRKEKWLYAGLLGAAAQATKPPGMLLFISLALSIILSRWSSFATTRTFEWVRKLPWKAYPLLLMPLTLLGIYALYGIRYGNFLAYFNSGDNIHLQFPPFQAFNPGQAWVGTFWLEEIVCVYLLIALGLAYLIKQKETVLATFVGVFLTSLIFVAHRDIARYALPVVPFIFVAFNKFLSSTEFKWILLLLIVPVYLFSIVFIANNVTPIADWGPLL